MIVSPHCEKYDMAIRLLTTGHCPERNDLKCESGECEHSGKRLFVPAGCMMIPPEDKDYMHLARLAKDESKCSKKQLGCALVFTMGGKFRVYYPEETQDGK
jgi:hypothetical protein